MAVEIEDISSQKIQKSIRITKIPRYKNFVVDSKRKIQINCLEHDLHIDLITGDTICKNCGLVIDEHLVISQKHGNWRTNKDTFSTNQQKDRNFSQDLIRALKRGYNVSWNERREKIGIIEINRITALHNIGKSINERAIRLFQNLIKQSVFQNHYIKLIAAVSFFQIIKQENNPLGLIEIIENSDFSIRLANKYYYTVRKLLNIRTLSEKSNDPIIFIPKICSVLRVNQDINELARKILNNFKKSVNFSGVKLKGIAAAGVYIACRINHIPKSQKEVSNAANITDCTLRSRVKEMDKYLRRNRSIWE
jgi:transcription initiation factor TFIIB